MRFGAILVGMVGFGTYNGYWVGLGCNYMRCKHFVQLGTRKTVSQIEIDPITNLFTEVKQKRQICLSKVNSDLLDFSFKSSIFSEEKQTQKNEL